MPGLHVGRHHSPNCHQLAIGSPGHLEQPHRDGHTGHRIQPRTQSSQAARRRGHRRRGRRGGVPRRNPRRCGRSLSLAPVARSAGNTSSLARTHPQRWWCPGTRCNRFAIRVSCSGSSMASSSKRSRPKRRVITMPSPAKSFTPITPSSVDCAQTSIICTGQCMTAPSRSSARSAPRRVAARRSRSPASAIRARRPSARSSCRPRA
jgi:hypothetical protein